MRQHKIISYKNLYILRHRAQITCFIYSHLVDVVWRGEEKITAHIKLSESLIVKLLCYDLAIPGCCDIRGTTKIYLSSF